MRQELDVRLLDEIEQISRVDSVDCLNVDKLFLALSRPDFTLVVVHLNFIAWLFLSSKTSSEQLQSALDRFGELELEEEIPSRLISLIVVVATDARVRRIDSTIEDERFINAIFFSSQSEIDDLRHVSSLLPFSEFTFKLPLCIKVLEHCLQDGLVVSEPLLELRDEHFDKAVFGVINTGPRARVRRLEPQLEVNSSAILHSALSQDVFTVPPKLEHHSELVSLASWTDSYKPFVRFCKRNRW